MGQSEQKVDRNATVCQQDRQRYVRGIRQKRMSRRSGLKSVKWSPDDIAEPGCRKKYFFNSRNIHSVTTGAKKRGREGNEEGREGGERK